MILDFITYSLAEGGQRSFHNPDRQVFLLGTPLPPFALIAVPTNFESLKIGLLCLLPTLCYEAPQRVPCIYFEFSWVSCP